MIPALAEPTTGPSGHGITGLDGLAIEAKAGEILNRWPAVGLAVGVVHNGDLESFHGHGLANIASDTPITEDTVFRIARSPRPSRPSP